MCGIAGFLRLDGAPASRDDARRMVDAMPHRGPDGRGAWSDGPVALAHARLAVRDLTDAAAQPIASPGGEGVLVYNGEVYDDGALREELERGGATFRGTGDTEVVAAAIARFGVEAAVRRFDGMFALAWWDARERTLWLARDRFGTKPLHVAVGPSRVAFASELRGLAALEPLRPDMLEVVRRFFPFRVDEERPPFQGVENVLPGELWRVTERSVERRTWCDVATEVDVDRLLAADGSPPEWERRIEEVVSRAVHAHLASDAPVAAFTSGGVDSNLVASYALERLPGLVGYTADTESPASEVVATRAMAEALRLPLRVVRVDRASYLRAWPESVEALEHPATHASLPAALLVARAARADGVKVALTGEGSDELFGGYDFFQRTRRQWTEASSWWRRRTHGGRRLARHLGDVPFRYQLVRGEPASHLRLQAALAPQEETRARDLLKRLERVEPAGDRAFLANCLDALRRHLGWILLRHDRVGMAASIEARVPFLSNRVADLALHLPVRAKVRGDVGKWALKRVAARRLPRVRVYARKVGFDMPEGHHRGATALLRGGAVPDLFRWSRAAFDDLVPRIEADPIARHQTVGFELWARLFVRGESAASLSERLLAIPG